MPKSKQKCEKLNYDVELIAQTMVDSDIYYEQTHRRLNPPRGGLEKAIDRIKYRKWREEDLKKCREIAKELFNAEDATPK